MTIQEAVEHCANLRSVLIQSIIAQRDEGSISEEEASELLHKLTPVH